jgi:type III pantothenate kinase
MTKKFHRRRALPESSELLLAIDAGNTNITIGVFHGERLLRTWRLGTNRHATSDELGLLFLGLVRNAIRQGDQVTGAVIASVVPSLDRPLLRSVTNYLHVRPVMVGPDTKLGIKNLYHRPEDVGADRLADAVAVYTRFRTAAIVVDFGTATTFNCINARGEYLGGAICPGIELASEWLATHAAKIPPIAFQAPSAKALGRTTKESLQSGLFWGYIGLVEGLLQRLTKEMIESRSTQGTRKTPRVVATGGLSPIIGAHLRSVHQILPTLTLDGLRLIWEKNK